MGWWDGGIGVRQEVQERGDVCVTKHKSRCLTHSEAKQCQNVGLCCRERCTEGPARREAHALKTFPNPKSSQRSPFPGKEGSGVGRGCKRLGVRCFVLEGRSWSVNNAPVTKQMLFPVLTRKGQVPRHSCLPLRSSGG